MDSESSSDVVTFDFVTLLQYQMRVAKRKGTYTLLLLLLQDSVVNKIGKLKMMD